MRPGPSLRALLASLALIVTIGSPIASAQGHAFDPASPVAGSTWTVTGSQDITVDGMPVALSPDGQWIAGIGPEGNDLCVWDMASRIPACGIQEAPIDPRSIVWSPDSTAVAFSSDAAMMMRESDIGVYEVETGTLSILTDDGVEGNAMSAGADTPLDIMPAWTQDSQSLVFSRSFLNPEEGAGAGTTTLARIAREGGDPDLLTTVSETVGLAVSTPMKVLGDGSVVYSVWNPDDGDPVTGIWILDAEGEPRQVVAGTTDDEFETPIVVDAWESADGVVVSGASSLGMAMLEPGSAFLLNPVTGETTALASQDDPEAFVAAPTIGPDGNATIGLVFADGESHLVIRQGETGSDLGTYEVAEPLLSQGIDWAANNTILIVDINGVITLLTVSPG